MVPAVATNLALAATLLTSAFAMPVDDAVLSAMAVKDVASDAAFAAKMAAATTVDADGTNHLYFYAINSIPIFDWCGEIDAASYVPAKIFEPRHSKNLAMYAAVTVDLITLPKDVDGDAAIKLHLGRCASHNYTDPYLPLDDKVSWFGTGGTLMGPTCAKACSCSFEGAGPAGLPPCKNVTDDPSDSSFCSLCGPGTGCPGCQDGLIKNDVDGEGIQLFKKPGEAGSYKACSERNQCKNICKDLPAGDWCLVHEACAPSTPPGCAAAARDPAHFLVAPK